MSDAIKAAEKRLEDLRAKREAAAETARLAELEAQIKRESRELEDDEFAQDLRDVNPDGELGIHFDFLRFGNHLVAFKKAGGPLIERWTKRLPKDGSAPNMAEVRNLARPCVTLVHLGGEPAANASEAFDAVAEEFPGAPVDVVNVLLEMNRGAAARRRGK